MSEEIKELTEKPAELSVSFAKDADGIFIEFADGKHEIPTRIVNYLGMETLETLAPKLSEVSFADFENGFNLKVQKDNLNSFQRKLIANHFRRRF